MKTTTLALFASCFGSLSLAAPVEKRTSNIQLNLGKYFGALGATTLTSTGLTNITASGGFGNAGVWPGNAIVGGGMSVSGSISEGGILAQNGQAACYKAYNNARALVTTAALPSSELAGVTVTPGVYTFPSAAVALTGTLTLDAQGSSSKQFIFKIDTTFGSAAASKIVLINNAKACNVYFLVGSSATIAAEAQMQGHFLAYTSIALASGASNKGTLCALNGAVTLINNSLVAQAGICPYL